MPPKKRKAGAASPKGAKKSKVKAEPGAAVAPRKRTGHAHQVVAALRSAPGGMAQDALAASCSLTKSELAAVLNQLAQKRRIQMAKGPDGDILFMLASEKEVENANKLDELSTNELHVYQVIQEKGRDGIWKRDIKHRTGLVEKEVNKILNKLEKQRLIKMEKTVLRMNGKMFFLYVITSFKKGFMKAAETLGWYETYTELVGMHLLAEAGAYDGTDFKADNADDGDVRCSTWRLTHRHLEIGASSEPLPDAYPDFAAGCLDFIHEEVREERLSILLDVIERYAVDGFELNLRSGSDSNFTAHFFHPSNVAAGRPLLTALVRKVREALRAKGYSVGAVELD